jgi:hypothetical protein
MGYLELSIGAVERKNRMEARCYCSILAPLRA